MELYFVRHGETDWNANHLIQGQTDIPLNDNGIKQAYELKEKLKGISFDICYCSELQRAKETASIIVGNQCSIISSKYFNERYMGELEGKYFNSYLEMVKYWDYDLDCDDNKVENLSKLLKRGKKALNFIDKSKKRILIVSHGAFIKAMNYCILGYNENTDFTDFHLKNCEFKKYKL